MQGWGAGAGRSRVFSAPWSRSRSRLKKNEEPEPLGKKSQEPEFPGAFLGKSQFQQKQLTNVYIYFKYDNPSLFINIYFNWIIV